MRKGSKKQRLTFDIPNHYDVGGQLDYYNNQIEKDQARNSKITGNVVGGIAGITTAALGAPQFAGQAFGAGKQAGSMLGGLFSNGGDLTYYNTGGTHSQNAYGGVSVGNNNKVEQGEYRYDSVDENGNKKSEVLSNRIGIEGKSYAKLMKKWEKKTKLRPNDSLGKELIEQKFNKLYTHQEASKKIGDSIGYNSNDQLINNDINKSNTRRSNVFMNKANNSISSEGLTPEEYFNSFPDQESFDNAHKKVLEMAFGGGLDNTLLPNTTIVPTDTAKLKTIANQLDVDPTKFDPSKATQTVNPDGTISRTIPAIKSINPINQPSFTGVAPTQPKGDTSYLQEGDKFFQMYNGKKMPITSTTYNFGINKQHGDGGDLKSPYSVKDSTYIANKAAKDKNTYELKVGKKGDRLYQNGKEINFTTMNALNRDAIRLKLDQQKIAAGTDPNDPTLFNIFNPRDNSIVEQAYGGQLAEGGNIGDMMSSFGRTPLTTQDTVLKPGTGIGTSTKLNQTPKNHPFMDMLSSLFSNNNQQKQVPQQQYSQRYLQNPYGQQMPQYLQSQYNNPSSSYADINKILNKENNYMRDVNNKVIGPGLQESKQEPAQTPITTADSNKIVYAQNTRQVPQMGTPVQDNMNFAANGGKLAEGGLAYTAPTVDVEAIKKKYGYNPSSKSNKSNVPQNKYSPLGMIAQAASPLYQGALGLLNKDTVNFEAPQLKGVDPYYQARLQEAQINEQLNASRNAFRNNANTQGAYLAGMTNLGAIGADTAGTQLGQIYGRTNEYNNEINNQNIAARVANANLNQDTRQREKDASRAAINMALQGAGQGIAKGVKDKYAAQSNNVYNNAASSAVGQMYADYTTQFNPDGSFNNNYKGNPTPNTYKPATPPNTYKPATPPNTYKPATPPTITAPELIQHKYKRLPPYFLPYKRGGKLMNHC